MSDDENAPPPAAIGPYLLAARDYVKRALGADLDGSEESLAFVDHYLEQQRPQPGHELSDEIVRLVGSALGVYFGEVTRKMLGGVWRALGEDPMLWRVELLPSGVSFSPVGMTVAALFSDEVEGFDSGVRPPKTWQNALEKVLAASAPVEPEYFYSLTGRYENLAHVCAILADFTRLTQPGGSGGGPGEGGWGPGSDSQS